jgi:hypothetical protein
LPLPRTPFRHTESTFAAGVYAGAESQVVSDSGWLLDVERGRWFELPDQLRDRRGGVDGETVVSAGDLVVVFGGMRWDDPAGLLDDTYVVDLDDVAR